MMTTRLTPEQARAEVLRRIAELEPEVARLKAERRAATIAERKAKRAYWDASIKLRQLRAHLFNLAAHVANGDPHPVRPLWRLAGGRE